MKHRHIIALALTLLAGLFTACEELEGIGRKPVQLSFSASLGEEIGTKTALQSVNIINWCPQDAIHVFYGNSEGRFVSTNTSETGTTTFEGELVGYKPNNEDYFWAVYPYSEDQTFSGDNESLTVSLPSTQTAVEGTFADDLFLSIARSKNTDLIFNNLCGGIMISVAINGVKRIVFRGKNGEILAGRVTVGGYSDPLSSHFIPLVGDIIDGETSLTLNAPEGGTFTPGSCYFLVSFPASLSNGYVMELYGDSLITTEESDAPTDIKRSVWNMHDTGDYTGLCIEAIEDGEITISNPLGLMIEYCRDSLVWTSSTLNPIEIPVSAGEIIRLRGNNPAYASYGKDFTNIQFSSDCYVYGNIMSLISATWYKNEKVLSEYNERYLPFCFGRLFSGNIHLLNHPIEDLYLPATTLSSGCYVNMFSGCTGLTRAPELPATTLTEGCYSEMFSGCSGLTTAPELPATTLADRCYHSMFKNCSSLTVAPKLPATTLTQGCYEGMFNGCSGLTTAPELPATTLAEWCYSGMFSGCSRLTAAPELPATTLTQACYSYMFENCSSLTTAPVLPATSLTPRCYYVMFKGCTGISKAPNLPATTLADECYYMMFMDCSSLVTAPELPATRLTTSCYLDMFSGCSSLTTAPDLPATTLADDCYGSMFYGCSSLTTAPDLPATTLADGCYGGMFMECWRLTRAPELPATTLVYKCYYRMFSGCSSLTTAPDLPSTTLAEGCYGFMFQNSNLITAPELPATTLAPRCYEGMLVGCWRLTRAPDLPATTLANECYLRMFENCSSLPTAPELPATTLAPRCYERMFENCSYLNYIKASFTTTPGEEYTKNWLIRVSSGGTFVKNPDATWDVTGPDGIPEGWTVVYD